MRKILCFLLVILIVASLAVGCGKKEEVEQPEASKPAEQIEGQDVTQESSEEDKLQNAEQELEYILYLKYKDKPFLYDEMFSISISDEKLKDKSIEEFVIEELISYEGDEDLVTPIPKGTKLLSVKREGNNVIVDLSKEFKGERISSGQAMVTLGGLVNTLVVLPGNETVQIKVEGQLLQEYYGIDTSKPLSFIEGLFPDK
ncbi:MAG: hypothetical protein PWQ37_797 [Candidatus Petromonas sp.]|nr:hypothetical protein [Candidatus Petromonas sp.]